MIWTHIPTLSNVHKSVIEGQEGQKKPQFVGRHLWMTPYETIHKATNTNVGDFPSNPFLHYIFWPNLMQVQTPSLTSLHYVAYEWS